MKENIHAGISVGSLLVGGYMLQEGGACSTYTREQVGAGLGTCSAMRCMSIFFCILMLFKSIVSRLGGYRLNYFALTIT